MDFSGLLSLSIEVSDSLPDGANLLIDSANLGIGAYNGAIPFAMRPLYFNKTVPELIHQPEMFLAVRIPVQRSEQAIFPEDYRHGKSSRRRFAPRRRVGPLIGIAVIIVVTGAEIGISRTELFCITAFRRFVDETPVGIPAGRERPGLAKLGIGKLAHRFHIIPFEQRYY